MMATDHNNASVTTLAVDQTNPNTIANNSPTSSEKNDGAEGVDVDKAEAAFEHLRRELSRHSSLHRTRTGSRDPEKGNDAEDDFDLLSYLQGAKDTRDQNGFRHKHLGVVFENMTVKGAGGLKMSIRTFPDALRDLFLAPVLPIIMRMMKQQPRAILEDFNGFAKPGELVLVLGRPGSGCSTFLKAITNQHYSFKSVEGQVSYGGIDAETAKKLYAGAILYNQEDDVHNATLTVGQTLDFALSLKTPGKLLPNESRKDFRREVSDLLLKMFNIEHTRNTMVGSAFVRGVSGGERKRVSIVEMMATSCSVASWDNSTRGLDASTALDYMKSLRILSDVFQSTNFTSLYQAGEGIYELADKVLLIDEGRQVYFGPANEARQYMISLGYRDLPRQTTADYLTGCTDSNERQFADGRDASNVPSTPQALAEAYKNSEMYRRMTAEREAEKQLLASDSTRREEFAAAMAEDKRRGVSPKSSYTVSFYTQVMALTKRQIQIKMQDRLDLYVAFATAIIVALITGSIYFKLPTSSNGAFTRGGVIFMAVLFNAFSAFAELPTQMLGRQIIWRQKTYRFYRPAAHSIASTLADAPLNVVKIMLFTIILYFMSGLVLDAGAFFIHYVTILISYFALSALFRLLGTLCSSFDVASRLAAVLITLFITYSGYLIPVYSMKRWLFWIYYANPVQYGFSAAMVNEFSRITLTCDGSYVAPRNLDPSMTIYPDGLGPNQVCTLLGSTAGSDVVSGTSYISASFDYNGNIGRNIGILILFFAAFAAIQAYLAEALKHGAGMPEINVFLPENKERKKLNEALQENKTAFRRGEKEQNLEGLVKTRQPFTFEKVKYTVPVSGGKLQLLNDVYGYAKPGTLTALMGSSGAGKTTLLDVLADRKTIGVIEGNILMNGRKIGKSFQRGCAYVEQQDVHESTATVREALRFSAYLRQPGDVPKAEKDAYVEEVIQLLEMEDIADAMIGFPGFGLGVEARKRVTIGVELAAKPQLLLFLDEPTSGLDGQSAFNIVRFLKKLAAAGQSIVCTVHQPNAMLFENFDRLLLLAKGGRTIYHGPIGKDSHVLRDYLARNGAQCPANANPAEFMLEAIGAGSGRRIGPRDWADIWLDSPEFDTVKREIEEIKKEALANEVPEDPALLQEYSLNFAQQLSIVSKRTFLSFWRAADYNLTRLFNHAVIGLLVGLTYLNVANTTQALQYRVFAIFFVSVLPAIIISSIEPMYIAGRSIFLRENSSKMYTATVFSLSQLMAEIPNSILCAVVFYLLWYFPIGFDRTPSRAGYQFLMVLITELFSVTLGQAVAALSPSVFIAASANPFLLVIFSLFCGVTIPAAAMPSFYSSWLYQLDPFTRLINGMVSTELHELPIQCSEREFYNFSAPGGQTCAEWAGPFIQLAGGYLEDPAATACRYCQYAVGDEFTRGLGISFSTRWREVGIFIAFAIFNCFVTVMAANLLKYAKR